ncbi:MAG: hypothetical protein QOJ02_3055, partial [Acidobacteriota bacterium]|nr:hypothetical protein [Acidobacteriota bacterium]
MSKIKSYLEVATNICVMLVSVVVLSSYAWLYFDGKVAQQSTTGLQKGKTILQLPKDIFGNSSNALIIAMNTKCHFCTESVPFYNKIATRQSGASPVAITAMFPNSADEVGHYAQENGLKMKTVASVDFIGLNVSATPTIILVDKTGNVINFWIGKLS